MSQNLQILIADDEQELRTSIIAILQRHFQGTGLQLEFFEASNGAKAIEMAQLTPFDFILMDVRMPIMTGLEALKKIKELDPRTFIVIMTAHSNVQDAVQAMKFGAYDYIAKPLQPHQLIEIVNRALEAKRLVSDIAMASPIFDDDIESDIVGRSHKMKEIFSLIHRLSQVDTTVLIRGENGTGKELVARAIHLNSPKKNGDFITVNCAAIPNDVMESELFGHEKGAVAGNEERKIGKFQTASSGTLFLDEVAELSLDMQFKLLRVLEERKFIPVASTREVKTEARILAATHENLERLIEEGRFREDLYYRLNIMPIFLPPLRDRKEDIEFLIHFFLKKFSIVHNRALTGVESDALQALRSYKWPGNIRELENIIQRCFIMENSPVITLKSLPEYVAKSEQIEEKVQPMDFEEFKNQTEQDFIVQALKVNKGRINKTVASCNIPKNTLLRKIKKYGINVKEFADSSASQTD